MHRCVKIVKVKMGYVKYALKQNVEFVILTYHPELAIDADYLYAKIMVIESMKLLSVKDVRRDNHGIRTANNRYG